MHKKTYSVALIALGIIFSGISPFQEASVSLKVTDRVQLLSTSVVAEFEDGSINISWDKLPLGNTLSVTTDQGSEVFFNSKGMLKNISPRIGKNFIEVTESTPNAYDEQSSNLEEFMTRVLILDLDWNQPLLGPDSAVAATASPTSTRLRYQTFIREKYLEQKLTSQCIPWLIKAAFGGDSRGFDPDSERFRTRFDVRVNWLSAEVQDYREVGQTSYYTWDDNKSGSDKWKWEKTMSQNADGMELTVISSTTSLAHFTMEHRVTNPFCIAVVPVVYNLDVYIAKSGKYTITGIRNTVPDHEVYIRTNINPDWTVIYQRYKYSYDCLGTGLLDEKCYVRPDLDSIDF